MYFDHLLQHFLSTDKYRPALLQPNTQEGIVYATDAHHVVAIPCHLLEKEYPAHEKTPNFKSVWPARERMRFSTIEINPNAMQAALQSVPKRIVEETIECAECEGDGVKHCDHCGHDSDCDECHGVGDIPTGKKIETVDDRYTICFEDTTHINPRLLLDLLRCAEATQQPIYLVTVCDQRMQLFTTGEIEVGIMPTALASDKSVIHFPIQP